MTRDSGLGLTWLTGQNLHRIYALFNLLVFVFVVTTWLFSVMFSPMCRKGSWSFRLHMHIKGCECVSMEYVVAFSALLLSLAQVNQDNTGLLKNSAKA